MKKNDSLKFNKRKLILGIVVSSVVTLICLVIIEICLWVFAPLADPYESVKLKSARPYINSQYPPNLTMTTRVEEGLPGLQGARTFSTNNYGFRGDDLPMPKPNDEYRVVIIGGSTTECLFLDDFESLDRALQNSLGAKFPESLNKKVKVYGAGKSGDRSDTHISMLVHRVVHLQPDLVIVFAGLNDLSASIFNFDYTHPYSSERISPLIVFRIFMTEFQIPRYLYNIYESLSPDLRERRVLEQITLTSNYKYKVDLRKNAPITDKTPKINEAAYRTNLKTIAGVAKSQGFDLVFMTQASTWASKIDPAVRDWQWMLYKNGESYKEDKMDKALEETNDIMRSVGTEQKIPFYDLAKEIPKSTQYFYNDVHFTPTGAKFAADGLTNLIISQVLTQIE